MHNVQPSFVSAGSPDLDDASPCSAAKSCDLKQAKGLGRRAQAWVVMGLAAIFLFYKYILQVSPGVMASSLMHDFHLHGMGLGHLAAVYFYAFVVVQLFSGVLLDRYSPRKVTSVAIGVAACGALMFACAHTLWLAVLARALIGVGVAFATVSYLKQASLYCGRSSAGWVSGLLATAVGLGALVGEAPIAYSTTQWGWRLTLVGCALLGGVIALLYWCCARDAKPVSVAPKPLRMDKKTLAGVVFKPCNLWLMLYSGLAFSPLAVFSGLWGNGYLQVAYHLNSTQAAAYITLSFVGLGLGAPLFGYVSDRLQKRCVVMVCGTVLSLCAFLGLLCLDPSAHRVLGWFIFLFGFGTGSFMLGFTLGKEMNTVIVAGMVVAMINTGDALLGAVTEPLLGYMLDRGNTLAPGVFSVSSYHVALSLLPCYLLASLFCAWRLACRRDTGFL